MSNHPDDSATQNEGYKHPGVVFSPPDDSLRPEQLFVAQPSAASAARTELLASIDPRLIQAKSSIERFLGEQVAARQGRPRSASFFDGAGNIQGVGIRCPGVSATDLGRPGAHELTVF